MTPYYGATALKQAHDAAEHGDTITLSSGTFAITGKRETLTKAVTIIGAGMDVDKGTLLYDSLYIYITDNTDKSFHLEGIYHYSYICVKKTSPKSEIVKCRLYTVNCDDKLCFVHCRIINALYGSGEKNLYNSIFRTGTGGGSYEIPNLIATNCVIILYNYPKCYTYSSFLNSAIKVTQRTNDYFNYLPSSTTARYCYAWGYDTKGKFVPSSLFYYIPYDDDTNFSSDMSFYEDSDSDVLGTGEYSVNSSIGNFFGDDDTPIGIYGGNVPYNPIPHNPQISNFSVGEAKNGKLNITIEVDNEE